MPGYATGKAGLLISDNPVFCTDNILFHPQACRQLTNYLVTALFVKSYRLKTRGTKMAPADPVIDAQSLYFFATHSVISSQCIHLERAWRDWRKAFFTGTIPGVMPFGCEMRSRYHRSATRAHRFSNGGRFSKNPQTTPGQQNFRELRRSGLKGSFEVQSRDCYTACCDRKYESPIHKHV
jgi:hypothetical protein